MYSENWNKELIKNTMFIERNTLMNVCEIGCFQGLSSNYICNELLAWNGNLVCIDPHDDDYQLESPPDLFKGQYDYFIKNTETNKRRITHIRKNSCDALPLLKDNSMDFIFVDGDHTTPSVYLDGTEAFRIAKVGALILFDDYLWNPSSYPVKQGVDRVLEENTNYRLLLKLNQVLVQKLEKGSPTEDGQARYQELSIEKLFNSDTIYMSYCNLDIRPERNEAMIKELERVGLSMERRRSFPWEELWEKFSDEEKEKYMVMYKRTKGAIGCQMSQIAAIEEGIKRNQHIWVNEDDIIFCSDIQDRLKSIYTFLNQREWDIFWFGGTFHKEPTWHKSIEGKHQHPDLTMCNCILNRDYEETLHPNIVRTYGCFSTHSYLINKDRAQHILNLIEANTYRAMGIDWIMILEQPRHSMSCAIFRHTPTTL